MLPINNIHVKKNQPIRFYIVSFAGVSARTQSLRCGILSSASTLDCLPIRSAVVIPPACWETSSPRATIMSTSSCFKGELHWENIISSSWANRSKALFMSACRPAAAERIERDRQLHLGLFVSEMSEHVYLTGSQIIRVIILGIFICI